MSRYTRLLNADHDTTSSNNNNSNEATTDNTPPTLSSFPTNQMSNMLNSLKESATNASSSVRTGLGLPNSSNNNNDDNSDLESQASNMLDEVSEYCPKMTYQQVRYYVNMGYVRCGMICIAIRWLVEYLENV